MEFVGFDREAESDDEVMLNRLDSELQASPFPSPPKVPDTPGTTSAQCTPYNEHFQGKAGKSSSDVFEEDRPNSSTIPDELPLKEAQPSSSRAKSLKRKGSHKSSKGGSKRKKTSRLRLEGASIEEAFLALGQKLHEAGALSEEMG
ncbi:unnamed protein product [Cuscuta campestris]|uniref:Uncharacterized protein n=1 Tax=Cuscuta campestris TaxID=132261 RepID=A0A484LJC4_9ASTE|nr:unnamed protein product [Cuscuta campestris]